jgi:Ca2+:H+ antiporter
VVRGSLAGSLVSNLLLVLGLALAVGGDGDLDRESTRRSLMLLALAVPLLAVAAVPSTERRSSWRCAAS